MDLKVNNRARGWTLEMTPSHEDGAFQTAADDGSTLSGKKLTRYGVYDNDVEKIKNGDSAAIARYVGLVDGEVGKFATSGLVTLVEDMTVLFSTKNAATFQEVSPIDLTGTLPSLPETVIDTPEVEI